MEGTPLIASTNIRTGRRQRPADLVQEDRAQEAERHRDQARRGRPARACRRSRAPRRPRWPATSGPTNCLGLREECATCSPWMPFDQDVAEDQHQRHDHGQRRRGRRPPPSARSPASTGPSSSRHDQPVDREEARRTSETRNPAGAAEAARACARSARPARRPTRSRASTPADRTCRTLPTRRGGRCAGGTARCAPTRSAGERTAIRSPLPAPERDRRTISEATDVDDQRRGRTAPGRRAISAGRPWAGSASPNRLAMSAPIVLPPVCEDVTARSERRRRARSRPRSTRPSRGRAPSIEPPMMPPRPNGMHDGADHAASGCRRAPARPPSRPAASARTPRA